MKEQVEGAKRLDPLILLRKCAMAGATQESLNIINSSRYVRSSC